jgi:hypothetical protein
MGRNLLTTELIKEKLKAIGIEGLFAVGQSPDRISSAAVALGLA